MKRLCQVIINNYRSISNLNIKLDENNNLLTICGANNVGKTNFLRALDLFFSMDLKKFDPNIDIPYHIAEGSRGQGYRTKIKCIFKDENTTIEITQIFTNKKNVGKFLEINGKKLGESLSVKECNDFINEFRFIFIESSNVDQSKKIAKIVNDDVLLSLDKLRKNQNIPLAHLEKFSESSRTAVRPIEEEISKIIKEYTKDIKGINSENWKSQIIIPDFDNLREVISDLITFTLFDTNNYEINTKGSGIQKIIWLSLVKYVSSRSKKCIIWGIDEPEAFLQPSLQKKVYSILKELSLSIPIVITTHSNHFIDLNNLSNTFLFESEIEEKNYVRRKGITYYKNCTITSSKTTVEKINSIKEHLGLTKNDSWSLLPFNILVEGEEDKHYLSALFKYYNLELPNFFVAGGVDKIPGYLEFLSEFSEGLDYTPKIICVLDNDSAGKAKYDKLNHKSSKENRLKIVLKFIGRYDGSVLNCESTIEDFIPPLIFFDSLNFFLKKKQYNTVNKNLIDTRNGLSNKSKKILSLCEEFIAISTPTKERLNIGSDGIKLMLCKKICSDIFTNQKYKDELNKYEVNIKNYLNSLLTI